MGNALGAAKTAAARIWCPESNLVSSGYPHRPTQWHTFGGDGVTVAHPRSKHDAGRVLDGRTHDEVPAL